MSCAVCWYARDNLTNDTPEATQEAKGSLAYIGIDCQGVAEITITDPAR
jgi:hypothetical protein